MSANNDVTRYALNRILEHLSESNYAPLTTCNASLKAFQGRAAARVIVKRALRNSEGEASALWHLAKDAQ
jgi:hypothetical protein